MCGPRGPEFFKETTLLIHTLRAFKFTMILLLPVLAMLSAARVDAAEPYSEGELRAVGSITATEYGPDFVKLRYELTPPDGERIPQRADYPFWVLAPEGASIEAKVESGKYITVGDDNVVNGPYSIDEPSNCGSWPRPNLVVRVYFVDKFRGAGMNKANLTILTTTIPTGDQPGRCRQLLTEAEIVVTFTGGTPLTQDVDLKELDPYLLEMAQKITANPEQAAIAWTDSERLENYDELKQWNEMLRDAHEDGELFFSRLAHGGIYNFTMEEFENNDVDWRKLDPDKLRFFLGKNEIPVLPLNPGKDRFRQESSFLFYVPSLEGALEPYMPLWVLYHKDYEPQKRAALSAPVQSRDLSNPEVGYSTKIIFEPSDYHHLLPLDGPQRRWATAVMNPGNFQDFEFQVEGLYDRAQPKLHAWLSTFGVGPEVKAKLYVNGHLVADTRYRGARVNEIETGFDPKFLREGTNRLTVEYVPNAQNSSPPTPLAFLMARLEVAQLAKSLPPQQPLRLRGSNEFSRPIIVPIMDGEKDRDNILIDVQDPFQPRYYELVRHRYDGVDYNLAELKGQEEREVIHAGPKTFRAPKIWRTGAPRSFNETQSAEYLAIAHSTLINELMPLLEHREGEYKVDHLSAWDCYGAFNYGHKSYRAIADAIQHTYSHREGPRLSDVLLVGEGSESWWELRRNMLGTTENLMPIYGWADPHVEIRGDDSYALFSGDGTLPDVEIGRISVNTPEELKKVVKKLIDYEVDPPAGEWLNQIGRAHV